MESAIAKETVAAAGAAGGPHAVEEALAAARAGLDDDPALVLVFASGAPGPAQAAAACADRLPVVGISGSGAIGPRGGIEQGCTALAFSAACRAGIGVAREASRDLRGAARRATREALAGAGSSPGLLLLLLDTRSGDQAEAVAGAYEETGPQVPIAGGAAGGAEPFQLAAGEVLADAVLAVALRTPGPLALGVAHGCAAVGAPSIATRTEGRFVRELDGRPAVEVYLENVGFDGLSLDDASFEALAVTHPLAQPELDGSLRVRHVLGRDGDALVCATHIPMNAAVQCTHETPEAIVATAAAAVGEALGELPGPARAALLFDCAGRKRAVADSLSHEISALIGAFGTPPPPLAGLFTHGEIARIRGIKGDRNHAIVVVAFG